MVLPCLAPKEKLPRRGTNGLVDLDALNQTGQRLSVRLSDDEMEASLVLSSGYSPTELEIEELLRGQGIVEGVDLELVTQIAQNPAAGEYVVARGAPPEPTVHGDLVLNFDPHSVPQPRIDDEGRVNYFDLGGIPRCEKGDVIARKTPGRQGVPGRTVRGEDVEAPVPRDPQMLAGANTVLVEDESGLAVVAEKSGQPIKRGGLVMVKDLYVVAGDLDVSVGNIDHNGSVLICGKISEQLVLRAKGDVTIEGNVDTATVVCGGELTVRGGILRESKVSCSGSLRTRFIERSKVQVEQHLFVQEDIMFSDVEVGGNIEVQSGVVGGKVQAAGYLRASYLGKRLGTPTAIEVGNLAAWNERLKANEARLAEAQELLVSAMQPLQELLVLEAQGALDDLARAMKEKLERSADQARQSIAEKLKASLRLKNMIQSLPLPKVLTPGGVIHPGVQVQIRSGTWKADSTTRATQLSEHRGEIEIY